MALTAINEILIRENDQTLLLFLNVNFVKVLKSVEKINQMVF